MEHQLFQSIVAVVRSLSKVRKSARCRFADEDIVKVHYWAVIHDRPVSWATCRRNWPIWWRKPIPSDSTMSRRLKSARVRQLLALVERRLTAPEQEGVFWKIDGKPLPIGGCSKDRQAGYGRAAGGKAKGYKLHAITGADGRIAEWRVAPMNCDERVIAARLLKTATLQGYVVADANYDSNKLHAICDQRGNLQMVVPRRYGPQRGTGHRPQTAGRRRSREILENTTPEFGRGLLHDRAVIEREYGNLTNWGGGLSGLPPWIRTHPRVYRWVQAKLALTALRKQLKTEALCSS